MENARGASRTSLEYFTHGGEVGAPLREYAHMWFLLACTVDAPLHAACPPVRISEVMADSDKSYDVGDDTIKRDWIEIENAGTELLDLEGMTLRHRDDEWAVPLQSVEIEAGAFQIFLA